MRPSAIIALFILVPAIPAFAHVAPHIPPDSIQLFDGNWLEAEFVSLDRKAAYLADGRIVTYGVIKEIRTCRDTIARELGALLPTLVSTELAGCWILRLPRNPNPIVDTAGNRLFSETSVFVNLMTTKAAALEFLLHFEPVRFPWAFLELTGSYGRSSSDGPREDLGPAFVSRSAINYEGFLFSLGVGTQHSLGNGRLEWGVNIGERALSVSTASSGVTINHPTEISKIVGFTTLRYVYAPEQSRFRVSFSARYFVSDPAVDAERERFSVGLGVGLMML